MMLGRFFLQCYLAITDFEFYQSVWQQSLKATLLFLLYLSAGVAIALTLIFAWQLYPAFSDFFGWAEENAPPFAVVDGRLEVQADQPLLLEYRKDPTWTFVFDTTGTYRDADGLEEPVMLFTRDMLFFRFQGATETYSWRDLGPIEVRPEDLREYKKVLTLLYFPLGYSVFLIYTMLAKSFQALLLCPIALVVGTGYGVRLSLKNGFTIALYSLVPAIAIDLAVRLTGLNISYFDLIYIVTAGIYTYFATQKCVVIQ
jgi:hypothetical protein